MAEAQYGGESAFAAGPRFYMGFGLIAVSLTGPLVSIARNAATRMHTNHVRATELSRTFTTQDACAAGMVRA